MKKLGDLVILIKAIPQGFSSTAGITNCRAVGWLMLVLLAIFGVTGQVFAQKRQLVIPADVCVLNRLIRINELSAVQKMKDFQESAVNV